MHFGKRFFALFLRGAAAHNPIFQTPPAQYRSNNEHTCTLYAVKRIMFYCCFPQHRREWIYIERQKKPSSKKEPQSAKKRGNAAKKAKVFMGNSMKKAEAQVVVVGFRLGGEKSLWDPSQVGSSPEPRSGALIIYRAIFPPFGRVSQSTLAFVGGKGGWGGVTHSAFPENSTFFNRYQTFSFFFPLLFFSRPLSSLDDLIMIAWKREENGGDGESPFISFFQYMPPRTIAYNNFQHMATETLFIYSVVGRRRDRSITMLGGKMLEEEKCFPLFSKGMWREKMEPTEVRKKWV